MGHLHQVSPPRPRHARLCFKSFVKKSGSGQSVPTEVSAGPCLLVDTAKALVRPPWSMSTGWSACHPAHVPSCGAMRCTTACPRCPLPAGQTPKFLGSGVPRAHSPAPAPDLTLCQVCWPEPKSEAREEDSPWPKVRGRGRKWRRD